MGVISLGCLKSVQEKGLLGQEKLSLGGQSEKREMKRGRKKKHHSKRLWQKDHRFKACLS